MYMVVKLHFFFGEIMPVTKSYFIPKVSLNPCSILKMSENKVKLMHSQYIHSSWNSFVYNS